MTDVTELRPAEALAEETYEPVYRLRDLSGNDTLRVYRIVRSVSGHQRIKEAVADGGLQSAQYVAMDILADHLEGDLLPLMIGLVEGNEGLFDGIHALTYADLSGHLTAQETQAEERYRPDLAELRGRESWKRVQTWMGGQPASAPIDLFNDLCGHDSFLRVFVSASLSVRLVKKVSSLLGTGSAKPASSETT